MPLGPSDEFLVLASDGVFDVFDNDQVRQRGGKESVVRCWK
jgi:serine/threonine protein phosphatase PrpC